MMHVLICDWFHTLSPRWDQYIAATNKVDSTWVAEQIRRTVARGTEIRQLRPGVWVATDPYYEDHDRIFTLIGPTVAR